MESDQRPHRTKSSSSTASTATSELFICFTTSRLSSSSMKLSSKSLLSPGRARGADPNQISLSSSLSRRLKTSGSMKGGQASPMFPNGGTNRKRGCAFENPEPSSPKVTCIGQVRVKTKKQGKKMRIITRSRRRGTEASFRRTESSNNNAATQSQELFNNNFQSLHFPNHQINGSSSNSNNQQECMRQRNQRWVHLPLTICEALRAFGSEFNCLFPNRSSCLATDKEKEESSSSSKEVRSESGGSSSCGAVFARWFVALQDGDGKGREIELVVGDDQERTERGSESSGGRSQRRQVFEGIEFKEERFNEGGGAVEEEGGRASICVPPKNALLLMRCRSDPVKMAALANRFWEMPAAEENEEDQEDDNEGSNVKAEKVAGREVVEKMGMGSEVEAAAEAESAEREDGECEEWFREGEEHGDSEELVESLGFEVDEELKEDLDENSEKCLQISEEVRDIKEKVQCQVEEEFFEQDEEQKSDVTGLQAVSEDMCSTEVVVDPENLELEEQAQQEQEEDEEREEEVSEAKIPEPSIDSVQSEEVEGEEEKTEAEVAEESTEEETETVMADRPEPDPEPEPEPEHPNMHLGTGSKRVGQNSVLPDCLLLMMCEPKLSMEVSKETWVCSTDFIRCLPERHVKKIDVPNEAKKRVSIDSKPPLAPVVQQPVMMQPPRSSCSFPVQSMATMIGQKLVGSAGYEPFVLTRCKSEPMRSAAKLAAAPETCFWKNRKLEQHRQAAMGVGAAGVGF
ncbi:hypothetical protein D8674_005283 [Pyrus ussuriensis x Pyrus communis]|uniref:Uncharacterized protein n=1 Tax=Pyrus ussuriensis x Pyrus communis TaxID=2448454 RepID=A0A5N5FR22_9ROSA|nr:hypothetical protein D8674_005283 [Pyrus ussuriensis x Pyrus communis]